MINDISKLIFLLLVISLLACNNENKNSPVRNKEMNMAYHVLTPYNNKSNYDEIDINKKFKIVTYINLYCEPCWQNIYLWKNIYEEFKKYSNLSFICIICSTTSDFDSKNKTAQINFPVFLDTRERFRVLNRFGNIPEQNTFLLNDRDEILLIGTPFTAEQKEKYLKMITKNN